MEDGDTLRYGIDWGVDGIKVSGVTNQLLLQLERYSSELTAYPCLKHVLQLDIHHDRITIGFCPDRLFCRTGHPRWDVGEHSSTLGELMLLNSET
jgi:hypothetical protein